MRYNIEVLQDFRLLNQVSLQKWERCNLCGDIRFDGAFMKKLADHTGVKKAVDCNFWKLSTRAYTLSESGESTPADQNKAPEIDEDIETVELSELTLEQLQDMYAQEMEKDVPSNMKNNRERIEKKLVEKLGEETQG